MLIHYHIKAKKSTINGLFVIFIYIKWKNSDILLIPLPKYRLTTASKSAKIAELLKKNIRRVVREVEGAALEMLLAIFEPLPKPLDFKGFSDIALSK